jgi:hypothetical protein
MELEDALRELVKQNAGKGVIVAKVLYVSEEYTFDCEDADGNTYLDVRLNALPGYNGVIITPKVDSTVFITDLGDQDQEHFLVAAGEIESVEIVVEPETAVTINDTEILLGPGPKQEPATLGDTLNSNLTSILTQLESLIGALEVYASAQAAAATGTLAPLAAGYSTLNAQLPVIKNQLSGIKNNALGNHLSETVRIAP